MFGGMRWPFVLLRDCSLRFAISADTMAWAKTYAFEVEPVVSVLSADVPYSVLRRSSADAVHVVVLKYLTVVYDLVHFV